MGNGDTQLTGVPGIGRQAAQRLARDELSKAIYHPHQSFLQWLLSQAERLLDRLSGGSAGFPGGWWALVALAALVVLIVAVVLRRIGPVARSRRARTGLLAGDPELTARGHRDQAERYAAAGDYAAAILEYLRAIAAGLEERGVLVAEATPGASSGRSPGRQGPVTLLITDPGLLTISQLKSLAQVPGDRVIVEPDPAVLAVLAPGVTDVRQVPVQPLPPQAAWLPRAWPAPQTWAGRRCTPRSRVPGSATRSTGARRWSATPPAAGSSPCSAPAHRSPTPAWLSPATPRWA